MSQLIVDAGDQTDQLLNYIFSELDDEKLDEIEVERKYSESPGLAREPVTMMAALTLGPVLTTGVVRLIERWLETKRERENMSMVLKGFEISEEAGKTLAEMAKSHSNVVTEYKLFKGPK